MGLFRTPRPPRPAAALEPAAGYRRWAATYADEINELQRLEADLRRELLPPPRGLRTLDVGAGTGRVTAELTAAGARVVATDLVAEMLLHAPQREAMRGRACVARAEQLPFVAASFDLAVCALTLAHVRDLSAALRSMVELLRPRGTLLVTDFHPDAVRRGWQRSFCSDGETWAIEQHAHPLDDYARILGQLGCRLEESDERLWEGKTVLFGVRARKASADR